MAAGESKCRPVAASNFGSVSDQAAKQHDQRRNVQPGSHAMKNAQRHRQLAGSKANTRT
jgi:hypothetical protein